MKLLSIDSYVSFNCIGGDCPISCCGGDWNIVVDKETADYYLSVEGEFGDKLRNNLVDVEGQKVFKLNENRDCPFLDKEKLCTIYKTLGSDKICYTCKIFPRQIMQIGDILFCILDNSCPEVTRMIMQRTDQIKTLFDDSNESMTGYSENIMNNEVLDRQRFDYAIHALNIGMHLLQNQDISVNDRLFLLLMFTARFQDLMKNGQNPTDIIGVFSAPDIYKLLLENKPIIERDYPIKIRAFMIVFSVLMANSYDHPMWKECVMLASDIKNKGVDDIDALKRAFSYTETKEIQTELEQLMVYRFFSVFMKGYDKSEYMEILSYECVMYTALITYIVIVHVGRGHACSREERVLFYTLCSRIGHSKRQLKNMTYAMKQENFYELDKLLLLIS